MMVQKTRGESTENRAMERRVPTDALWVVTGPGFKTKLIEAPSWYLARERFGGASPLLCEAIEYQGIGELRHLDGYEWDVVGTMVSG
jgi:hypothetical protein